MTRDPVDAAEIEHDLASQKGMDVDAREREIVQECEDLKDHDWVHGLLDASDLLADIARQCFATDKELGTAYESGDPFNAAERLFNIKDLFRKEFQFYAQKRAERERDPS